MGIRVGQVAVEGGKKGGREKSEPEGEGGYGRELRREENDMVEGPETFWRWSGRIEI